MDFLWLSKRCKRELTFAVVIFDRFHVIKTVQQEIDELRANYTAKPPKDLKRDVLKGTRWLLLKNHEKLDPRKREPGRLKEALKLNESLAAAYYLKDDLNQLWEQDSAFAAQLKMYDWYHRRWPRCSSLPRVRSHTVGARTRYLVLVQTPISNGQVEGTNNKIKTMNVSTTAYATKSSFKLKLYQLHEKKYALVG